MCDCVHWVSVMTYAVVLQFTFDQAETNVHSLLATAIGVMEEQRNKSARDSSDNQQLCFIISDGLLASRGAQLARLISEAAEKNILIVFLLIDNQGGVGAGSVLDIQSITRTSSGRMMHKLYMGETRIRTRTQRSAFLTCCSRFVSVPVLCRVEGYCVAAKDIGRRSATVV